jgi:hydroxypyruvate reductase
LAALGPDGILVNIARGSVVDEAALIRALECGTLGGAALDVFANEPNIDSRLLELENIVLSPHAASFTQEAREQMFQRLVGAADAYFE